MGIEDVADELYGLAPEDFTAARNARAKAARTDGDRELTAAVVRWVSGGEPFATQGELASALCRDPRPSGPLVGANNWYYAYGRGFDADAVSDALRAAGYAVDHE